MRQPRVRNIDFILVIILIIYFTHYVDSTWHKLLRWECNTSGIIITKPQCRAKSISRQIQVVDFGFELPKRLDKFQITYLGFIKPNTGSYWRQFIKLDKFDPCGLAAGLDNIAYLSAVKDYYLEKFPQMPKKCPVEAGKYYAKNVTIVNHANASFVAADQTNQFLGPSFPNGIYRHVLRIFNKHDPVGFTLFWHIEHYDSMGEDRF